MSLKANQKVSSSKKSYPVLAKGTYPARVVQIVDLGVQQEHQYPSDKPLYWTPDGKKVPEETGNPVLQPRVFINFEFPTKLFDYDGEQKPYWVGKEFTVSNDDRSNMYALMEAAGLDPVNGNIGSLLDKTVQATIGETSGGKAKVTTITAVMEGITVPELVNTPVLFDLDEFDTAVYENLPSWLKDKIDNRVVANSSNPQDDTIPGDIGDIPF